MSTIKNPDIAYKIGFSSAMKTITYSAYHELATWDFEGTENELKRMRQQFCRGYAAAIYQLQNIKRQNQEGNYIIPKCFETKSASVQKELSRRGYCIVLIKS